MAVLVTMQAAYGDRFAVGRRCRAAEDPVARADAKRFLLQELAGMLGLMPFFGGGKAPAASFSHLPGETWAAVAPAEYILGVDAATDDEFPASYPVHRVFRPAELSDGFPPAGLWSMKEAVVKALGCGFAGLNPRDVILRPSAGTAGINGLEGISLSIWSCRQPGGVWLSAAYALRTGLTEKKKE